MSSSDHHQDHHDPLREGGNPLEPLLVDEAQEQKASPLSPSKAHDGLHWFTAGLITFAFAAPGAVVGIPFSIGASGLALGIIMTFVMTIASVLGAMMLLEVRKDHPDARNLPELGRASMGELGFYLALIPQKLNFIGFLPVALLLVAESLKGALQSSVCVNYYIIFISFFTLALTQVRDLTNTKWLVMASLTAIIMAAFIEIYVVATHENPDKVPAGLFGPPGPMTRENVFKSLLGLTTTVWAYAPSFLAVELSAAMPRPIEYRASILLSGALNIVLCLGLGVTVVMLWGWDVADPLFLSPAWPISDKASRAVQWLIMIANLVGYSLDAVPLVRFCQRSWVPNFKDDWSLGSMGTYLMISLPTYIFALCTSIVVGNLLSMLSFVTAFSVPFATQIVPAILYTWHRLGEIRDDLGSSGRLPFKEKVAIAYVGIVGCTSFVCCLFAAVGKVSIKSLRGPTAIGCPGWLVYSDADGF